jgi:hypothetical protein
VPYFHVVFTPPTPIADLAYQNKEVIYDLLFKASSETVLAIAADPKHLGARIGITAMLYTWGSTMMHHSTFMSSSRQRRCFRNPAFVGARRACIERQGLRVIGPGTKIAVPSARSSLPNFSADQE